MKGVTVIFECKSVEGCTCGAETIKLKGTTIGSKHVDFVKGKQLPSAYVEIIIEKGRPAIGFFKEGVNYKVEFTKQDI